MIGPTDSGDEGVRGLGGGVDAGREDLQSVGARDEPYGRRGNARRWTRSDRDRGHRPRVPRVGIRRLQIGRVVRVRRRTEAGGAAAAEISVRKKLPGRYADVPSPIVQRGGTANARRHSLVPQRADALKSSSAARVRLPSSLRARRSARLGMHVQGVESQRTRAR